MIIFLFIVGFATGVVVDNMFAPKVVVKDGEWTLHWRTDKERSGDNKTKP